MLDVGKFLFDVVLGYVVLVQYLRELLGVIEGGKFCETDFLVLGGVILEREGFRKHLVSSLANKFVDLIG